MNEAAPEKSDREIVRLEKACKIYRMGRQEVPALNDATVSFGRGSFWAIMGPSGSGKSTMMNILGCLDRLTRGTYFLEGYDVSTLSDNALSEFRLRHLGFIFQSFNLIPQLTVQRNIELPLYYLGWDAAESSARAVDLAQKVGLEARLDHRPAELSGGQMQRVAIARALANDPQILFADEPTGNLDTKTGEQIMEILAELNRQGKTVIMVTHEAHVAAYTRQRMHMLDGRIDRIDGEAL
jgi:putative ABC transport system ATP-binding protein